MTLDRRHSLMYFAGSLRFDSLPTGYCLLITFENRLDPYQAQQNVRSDLDPICLTLRWYS